MKKFGGKQNKIGDEITYRNFLSTSSERDIAIKFLTKNNLKTQEASLIIVKGKKGKLIEGLSTLPSEKEILFKSETIFKVEKVGFSPNPEDYMIPIKTIWLKEL